MEQASDIAVIMWHARIEVRMNRLRKRNSHSVPVRIIKKLLLILLVIGIPSILFISTFNIKKLEVIGTKRYKPEQITSQLMKNKLDTNALYFYMNYNYFTKVRLPFIEKIDVTMTDPHSITVYVYEKMVAGCVEFMGEYMYFDKDGIIVECSVNRLEDVPIIKGLVFSKIILSERIELMEQEKAAEELEEKKKATTELEDPKKAASNVEENKGTTQATEEVTSKDTKKQKEQEVQQAEQEQKRIEEQTDELFNTIINLTQLIDKYELTVDTVSFNKNYEVILDCGDITVLLGKKNTYDEELSELKSILEKAYGRKITIDLSKGTDNIVGKPKTSTN